MQQNPDLSTLLRLAQSSPGRQLIALLQQSGGKELQTALEKASAGDYEQAKASLAGLMSSDEVQKMLKQLEAEL